MAEDWELNARLGAKIVEDDPGDKAFIEGEVSSLAYTTVLDPTIHTVEEALNKLFTNVLPVHQLDGAAHSVSGLTPGHFLKALSATTFGFAAHGLTYTDVGAAAAAHVHSGSDITSGTLGIGVIPTGSTNLTVCIGNDSRLSDARTPTAHTHAAGDVTSGAFDVARIPTGNTSSTVCIGNDARLSDARTPTAHVHAAADITSGTLDITRIPTGNTSSTVCIGNDGRLSDSRTPTAHVLDSASHTVSGLTTGHVLQALTATTFGFAAIPTSAWNTITAPTANQSLTMGTYTSTWTYTSGFAVKFEDGKVGIGITTPETPLHIYESYGTQDTTLRPSVTLSRFTGTDTPVGCGGSLLFKIRNYSDSTDAKTGEIGTIVTNAALNNLRPAMVFCTGNAGTLSESMRITHDGNVGIGNAATPLSKLHIIGGAVGNPFTAGLRLTNTSVGGREYRILAGIVGVSEGGFSIVDVTSGDATNRLVINAAGCVGVNHDTSLTSKLHVNGIANTYAANISSPFDSTDNSYGLVIEAGTDAGDNGLAIYSSTLKSGGQKLLFSVDGNGNTWTDADCSALTFTDRTPIPESTEQAMDIVNSLKAKIGVSKSVDHDALHELVKVIGTDNKPAGRDLSMFVSALAITMQDVCKRLEALEP